MTNNNNNADIPIKFKKAYNLMPYNFRDKKRNAENYIKQMANRTAQMFKWDGLPETVNQRDLELMLQGNGFVVWHEVKGNLYVFVGGLGGSPYSVYYEPTWLTFANPALKISKQVYFENSVEWHGSEDMGVLMNNDTLRAGLLPIFEKYATMLAENDLTMLKAIEHARSQMIITANSDRVFNSAQKMLDDLAIGKDSIVRGSLADENALKALPFSTEASDMLTNLIEVQQYLKASFYNDLGLNANYNMKRESLNSAESQMNFDALLPLVDDMFNQRKLACEKVNAMFGTNISVKFNSAWEDEQLKINSLEDLNDVNDLEDDNTVTAESVEEENTTDAIQETAEPETVEQIEEPTEEPEQPAEEPEEAPEEVTEEVETPNVEVNVEVVVNSEDKKDEEEDKDEDEEGEDNVDET